MSASRRHPDSPPSASAEVAHHAPARAAWTHVLAVSVGLTALLCVLVVAFAWPATQLAPRSLPRLLEQLHHEGVPAAPMELSGF